MAKAPAQKALAEARAERQAGMRSKDPRRTRVEGPSSNEPWTLALALGITEGGRCKGQPSASTLTLAVA